MGVGDRVRFELTSLPSDLAVDLLVANLPYVPAGDLAGLEPEIAEYEPVEALSPGPTGLEAIDALLGELSTAPVRPQVIGLEVGIGQASTVADLIQRAGYGRIDARPDLSGIERVVAGWA
jgi:release factor glutamine methyltransferase